MTQSGSYTRYSIGCAAVWAAILAAARRRLDPDEWRALTKYCGAWWSGWLSATIARIGYPPPKELTPGGKKRLERISLVLVALGLSGVVRFLVRGKLED